MDHAQRLENLRTADMHTRGRARKRCIQRMLCLSVKGRRRRAVMHPRAREHMLDADLHAIANSRTGDCARIYPNSVSFHKEFRKETGKHGQMIILGQFEISRWWEIFPSKCHFFNSLSFARTVTNTLLLLYLLIHYCCLTYSYITAAFLRYYRVQCWHD